MPIDFAKLGSKPKVYVTYRCNRCGDVSEYITEMPKNWKHYPTIGKCSGTLVEVSRRTVDGECCQCGSTTFNDQNLQTPVTWRCHVCKRAVCGRCTLKVKGKTPPEYYTLTLCSDACWEKAGKPDD